MKFKIVLLLLIISFGLGKNVCAQLCFDPPTNYPYYSSTANSRNIVTGDFNGDGTLDLAVANYTSGSSHTVSIYLGTGSGTFGAATIYNTAIGTHGIAIGDLNGDGILDIVTANKNSNNVSILIGTGTGSFGIATNIPVGSNPQAVVIADFNKDGKMDLVVANTNSTTISILLGNGNGSFGTPTNFTVSTGPNKIVCKDFNGDGNIDIAVSCFGVTNSNVSVLLGNGLGSFGAATNFNVDFNVTSITSGDFNGDGILDLATGNGGATVPTVSILLGTGTGSFGTATNIPVNGFQVWDIISADFNGDGIVDLATADNASTNSVSILVGNGTGGFAPPYLLSVGGGGTPLGLTSGDFNGDGKADIATATYLATSVTVFLTCKTAVSVNFTMPDTVCVNTPIAVQNKTVGGTSYYWNFCSGNLNATPTTTVYSYPVSNLSWPVYSEIVQDGSNYYCFVTEHQLGGNNSPGGLSRLDFGNSLNNTPTITQLGSLGGVLLFETCGLSIRKEGNQWIGYVTSGYVAPTPSSLIKLNFGTSITNVPVATNLGNLGNLSFPHKLQLFQEGSNWFGITVNTGNNTITKFSFGNSLNNVPVGTNLGNLGNLNYPMGFYVINDFGSNYLFITNTLGNTITRLNFGNSMNNIPTAINLGKFNSFVGPSDITVIRDCGRTFGFVTNIDGNKISRLDFGNSFLNTPTDIDLGNVGSLNRPHSISQIFRTGNSINFFVPNVGGNSITRFSFNNCTSSSVASSTLFNPPSFSYALPGMYNVALFVDEGLATQNILCKQITVLPALSINLGNDTSICRTSYITLGNSLPLGSGITYLWSNGKSSQTITTNIPGKYWVKVSNGSCETSDTIFINSKITSSTFNQIICEGQSYFGYKATGIYIDTLVSSNGCDSIRTLNLTVNLKKFTTINQNICEGQSYLGYKTTGTYVDTLASILGCDSIRTLYLTVNPRKYTTITKSICEGTSFLGYSLTGNYIDTLVSSNGCDSIRNLNLTVIPNPTPYLGKDTTLCSGDTLIITPGKFQSYLWQDGSTSETLLVTQPGLYSVGVTNTCATTRTQISINGTSCELVFPNAFTPNNDQLNDSFRALNVHNIQGFHLEIYNRWGERIFESSDVKKGWDGTYRSILQGTGNYIWICNYIRNNRSAILKGNVVLIR